MKFTIKITFGLFLGLALGHLNSFAQTDGTARMAVTINDYVGTSGASHWTLVWVTTEAGAFIKTLWKQGTSYAFTSSQWTTHTPQWNAARGGANGSTIVDGYTSATATSYTGTNSPIILTWNCRNTNGVLVADGNYKFWVQYAENSGAGPYTTNGLLWTKGPTGATNHYAALGANFTGMQTAWRPTPSTLIAPTITSTTPTPSATVGVPYQFTVSATGTAPITFTAVGLPPGVAIGAGGVISGTPRTAGTFAGTITAGNGTPPNATQDFSIFTTVVPTDITAIQRLGSNVLLSGRGPANGIYAVLISTNADASPAQWTAITTNSFDGAGQFNVTNTVHAGVRQEFYQLRVP